MEMCLMVEEQELKERLVEEVLNILPGMQPDLFLDNCVTAEKIGFVQGIRYLQQIASDYNVVRMRNEQIRKEEYGRF